MIEDILDYMKNELKIKISKSKTQQIISNFSTISTNKYKNYIYWYVDVNERTITFFFEGLITKEQYEKIKLLDQNKIVHFGEIAKHCYADAMLSEIVFTDESKKILMYVQGNQHQNIDLIEVL